MLAVSMKPLLSREECVQIIQDTFEDKSLSLVSHVVQPLGGEKKGFLGDYFTLELTAKDQLNNYVFNKYFVKTPVDYCDEDQDDTQTIFRKESSLYPALLNPLAKYSKTKWKPNCFLARNDIIVMEDLIASHYEPIPAHIEPTIVHLKSLLASLAAFHASSIAYEEDKGCSIGLQFGDNLRETSVLKNLDWFQVGVLGLQAVTSVHPKYQSADQKSFIENDFVTLLDPVYEMVNESSRFRNVLCHRDTWWNNSLFLFENQDYRKPSKCVLVDFQTCRYCPPAVDVLFAIYLNMSRSAREQVLPECLQWYHQQLTRELKTMSIDVNEHISWESFLKSCHHLKLLAVLYNCVVATLIKVPSGFLEELRINSPEEFAKYRTVSRKEVLLRLIKDDVTFRTYMFEIVDELMDLICKNNTKMHCSTMQYTHLFKSDDLKAFSMLTNSAINASQDVYFVYPISIVKF